MLISAAPFVAPLGGKAHETGPTKSGLTHHVNVLDTGPRSASSVDREQDMRQMAYNDQGDKCQKLG